MTHLLHRDLSLQLFWFLPGTLTQGLIQLCFIQQHGQALALYSPCLTNSSLFHCSAEPTLQENWASSTVMDAAGSALTCTQGREKGGEEPGQLADGHG